MGGCGMGWGGGSRPAGWLAGRGAVALCRHACGPPSPAAAPASVRRARVSVAEALKLAEDARAHAGDEE